MPPSREVNNAGPGAPMKPDHKLLAEIARVEAECNTLIDKATDQERSPAIPWPCFRAMHVVLT